MEREQILTRKAGYLLLMEWIAGICIFLPVVLAGVSFENLVADVLAGVLLCCLVILAVQSRISPGRDFFRTLEEHVGRVAAVAVCVTGFWYFLAHTAVFARLWAELFRTYLTPAIPAAVLCVFPLAAGLAYLRKDLFFPFLSGNIVYRQNEIRGQDQEEKTEESGIPKRQLRIGGAVRLAGFACAVLAGTFSVAACASLSRPERRAADFPAVEALRRIHPFGGAVGRLEILFVLLLLAGLVMTVAGGIWHAGRAFGYLYAVGIDFCRKKEVQDLRKRFQRKLSRFPYAGKIICYGVRVSEGLSAVQISWWTIVLAVYVMAVRFVSAFAALTFYFAYNMQILVPAMLGMYMVGFVAERTAKKLL